MADLDVDFALSVGNLRVRHFQRPSALIPGPFGAPLGLCDSHGCGFDASLLLACSLHGCNAVAS